MRDILQVAQTSSILQVELGNACSKLQMRKLFLAPVAPQISDPTLTAIIKGTAPFTGLKAHIAK